MQLLDEEQGFVSEMWFWVRIESAQMFVYNKIIQYYYHWNLHFWHKMFSYFRTQRYLLLVYGGLFIIIFVVDDDPAEYEDILPLVC